MGPARQIVGKFDSCVRRVYPEEFYKAKSKSHDCVVSDAFILSSSAASMPFYSAC